MRPPWPRSLRVVIAPTAVFNEAAQAQRGLGVLALWLCWECFLSHPSNILAALLRLTGAPVVAVRVLWGLLAQYAVTPIFVTLVGGIAVHFISRRTSRHVDLWAAAAALSYAYMPHILLVSVGTVLGAFDITPAWLPPNPQPAAEAGTTAVLLRRLCEYGPVAGLAALAAIRLLSTAASPPARRPRVVIAVIPLLIALWVVAGGVAVTQRIVTHWNTMRPLRMGDPFPTLTFHGFDRSDTTTNELLGHVVLIDFWATWCPPCVASMPHLQALQNTFGPRGLRILAVNIEPDNRDGVRRFMDVQHLQLPLYLDDGTLQQRLHVNVYPSSFVVDGNGTVRKIYTGPADPADLTAQIEACLAP